MQEIIINATLVGCFICSEEYSDNLTESQIKKINKSQSLRDLAEKTTSTLNPIGYFQTSGISDKVGNNSIEIVEVDELLKTELKYIKTRMEELARKQYEIRMFVYELECENPEMSTIFQYYFIQGWTYDKISEKLGYKSRSSIQKKIKNYFSDSTNSIDT